MGHWGWGWLLASTIEVNNGTRLRKLRVSWFVVSIPAGTLSLRSSPSRKDQTEGPHNLESVVSSALEGFGGVQLELDCLLLIIIQSSIGCVSSVVPVLAHRFSLFALRSRPARPWSAL